MGSIPAVLVTVTTVTQNLLRPSATFSIIARHLLDSVVQRKITVADTPTIHLDATPSRLSIPPSLSSAIFRLNALSVAAVPVYPAWYRHQIMLACIPGGLVCIFSLIMWIYEYHKSVVIVQYCLLIWCKFWPFAATAFLLQRVYVILVWVLYVCSINCFSVCRCWDSQILFLIYVIFTAWCYASAVYAVSACLCVRPSVCLSQIGIVSKWLDR